MEGLVWDIIDTVMEASLVRIQPFHRCVSYPDFGDVVVYLQKASVEDPSSIMI